MRNIEYKLIILFLSLSFSAYTQEWKTFKIEAQEYKISFPGKAKYESREVPTVKGNVIMHTYTLQGQTEDQNILYMSSYTTYPEIFFPGGLETIEAQNTVLDNSVNGSVTNVNGTLLSKESIVFNGYPGRFYKIGVDGNPYVLIMKSVLVGYNLYLLQTVSENKDLDNRNSTRFFNSFELIKVKH